MEIKVVSDDIINIKTGAIIVNIFESTEKPEGELAKVDKALDGTISQLISQGEIKGKLNEVTLVHTLGKLSAARVVVVGLGKQKELNLNKVRDAVAITCRWLRRKGIDNVATVPQGAGINGITTELAAQAITEGALLGLYTFRTHITKKDNDNSEIKLLTIAGNKKDYSLLEQGSRKGKIMAEAANLARDLVNEPGNFMTPTQMAVRARKLAETYGLEITVLEQERMAEMEMGALLGVARGSRQPPKFIVLNYRGSDSSEIDIALVGKGITFDSGGISIKPSEGMGEMKGDMAGAASVIAAITAIAQLKPRINVTAIAPTTENMPDGDAIKPGDVLTAMNGKTIEIISTDAEGRLVLADALTYARKQGAKKLIDVATLTGACRIALGDVCSASLGNNQELIDEVIAAGNEAGECTWQMPMNEEYKEQLKSDVADMKNAGTRYGGVITGAKFIEEFAEDTPWVHMDIAGPSQSDKERGYIVKGGTGIPVRTLVNLVLNLSKS